MGKNNNYKIFPINSVEDGMSVLGQLIMTVKCDLEKYSFYNSELNDTIQRYVKFDSSGEILETFPVPEKVFHDLNDKILYRQMMMLKALADEQNASFSYKNFRRFLEKQHYVSNPLSEEAKQILNDFLEIRNWTFHNPQSFHSAAKEVAEKSISDELKSIISIKPQLNPVCICLDDFYDITYLISLDMHMNQRMNKINIILESMISDYKEMYKSIAHHGITFFNGERFDSVDVHFKIYRSKKPREILDQPGLITQISMAIQKSQYDGTKEAFNKLTWNRFGGSDTNNEEM